MRGITVSSVDPASQPAVRRHHSTVLARFAAVTALTLQPRYVFASIHTARLDRRVSRDVEQAVLIDWATWSPLLLSNYYHKRKQLRSLVDIGQFVARYIF